MASREVTGLEVDILKLRTLLRSRADVVLSLATMEWPVLDSKHSDISSDIHMGEGSITSKFDDKAKTFPDAFDVLLEERRIDLALSALEEGEDMIDKGYDSTNVEDNLNPVKSISAAVLHVALSERRIRLVNYLSDVCRQVSVRGVELRSAISALIRLGEGNRAHTLLLLAHRGRLEHKIHGLRPSGTSYGGAFTAALSQMTFSAISQAERDSLTVFGAIPAYASELVVWARGVTEIYAHQIKQHVLSSAAAAGGLRAAAECVQIAFGHCSLLEAQGLSICPLLAKVFRSSIEQALEANLKRIEESVTAMVSADDWMLTFHPQTPLFDSQLGRTRSVKRNLNRESVKLSCSAHRFNCMAQDFMAGVSPLVSMQLAGVALEGLAVRFNNYVDMLIKAVPDFSEVKREQTARTVVEQLGLLSNATALANELLPRSALKLLPGIEKSCEGILEKAQVKEADIESTFIPELKDWRQNLRKAVKRLQFHICKYHVKLLLYSADRNELQINPATYLILDVEETKTSLQPDCMPSLVFQLLFARLNSISEAAEVAFIDRGVVTPLLARLLEVFVIYMDEDKFWSTIEDCPSRIGPTGLKQFVLNMQFIIQMASSSGWGSRSLHSLLTGLTSRAVHAFAATGADPESVLPSDDWFLEAAHTAIQKLTEVWNQMSVPAEPVAELLKE
ncbi:exocyst complex component EXO84B isoform X2 [Physcomitrium patens]|uniref:exocyst complex component EXO84B isoform X2 n=1 Tax=Physcomitrium patens TaxID=3218 RepID=UPI003CCE226B